MDPEASKKRLLFFYGRECEFCHQMMPLIDRAEKELGIKFERFETWHDENNAHELTMYDKDFCGGVPFFYNTEIEQWICGATDYETLIRFMRA